VSLSSVAESELSAPYHANGASWARKSSRKQVRLGTAEQRLDEAGDRPLVGSFGLIQLERAFASRTAFSMYASMRPRYAASPSASGISAGKLPRSVWYSRYSSLRDGAASPSTARFLLRLMRLHRRTASRHAAGSSEITSMRARTSSARLLSWVELASIVCGHFAARSALAPWKADTVIPKCSGWPPTSFSEASRLKRYSAVSSTPFAVTGAVNCWKRIAKPRYSSASSGVAPPGGRASSALRTKSNTVASPARLSRLARATAQST
jgi:hypothetical protein